MPPNVPPVSHKPPPPSAPPAKHERREAAAPEAQNTNPAAGSTPTPTQAENDAFATQQMTNSLPRSPWHHAQDGSPIDPKSFDPTPVSSPTWP